MTKAARDIPTAEEARRIRAEMAAFDRLPPELRALYRENGASCVEMDKLISTGAVTAAEAVAFAARMGAPS